VCVGLRGVPANEGKVNKPEIGCSGAAPRFHSGAAALEQVFAERWEGGP